MPKYINADKILSHLNDEIEACGNPDGNNEPITYGTMLGLLSAKAFIETAETADMQEVRHGHWILRGGWSRCSECDGKALLKDVGGTGGLHEYDQVRSDICPNCGAKMDKKE